MTNICLRRMNKFIQTLLIKESYSVKHGIKKERHFKNKMQHDKTKEKLPIKELRFGKDVGAEEVDGGRL